MKKIDKVKSKRTRKQTIKIMDENKIDIINSKLATKQLELNDEKAQEKRNEIMHQIKMLNVIIFFIIFNF